MKMAKINNLVIKNPNADFIVLQKLLNKVSLSESKRGDIKFIDSVIDDLGLGKEDLKKAYKLIDSLMFRNQTSEK